MKKYYFLSLFLFLAWFNTQAQMRYLNEVFSSWQYAKDSVYGSNYQVLTGSPVLINMKCDIYQPPTSDTASKRPLIILLHTGSFLPKYINQNPTGGKDDSATMELARGFARRGYTVCVPAYRQGWNPAASTQEARGASIMQAVFRGLQDAKAAVRYMKRNAALYKIDTNQVIMGGQGTGGYIAMTYAYLHTNAEMRYSKFIGSSGPFIDTAALGDIENQLNGTMSVPNHPGYGSGVSMAFNLGGAIGDLTWMGPNEIPVVGLHSYTDPFTCDTNNMVVVPPAPGQPVIPVDGSRNICRKADQLNIQPWKSCNFTDPYSVKAKENNEGWSGFYRFKVPYPAPYVSQSGPWEWWDSTTVVNVAFATLKTLGYPDTTALKMAKACHANGIATNQFMSKTKALAYIDTIQNFLAPRIMVKLHLLGWDIVCPGVGIDKVENKAVIEVYPNPAKRNFTVKAESEITNISLTDISGREIYNEKFAGMREVNINRAGMANGLYLVRITTSKGEFVQRLVIE